LPSVGPIGPHTLALHVPMQSVLSVQPWPSGHGCVVFTLPPQSRPVSPPFFFPSVWLPAAGCAHLPASQKTEVQSRSSSQASPSLHGAPVPTPHVLPAGAPQRPLSHLPLPHCSPVVHAAPVHLEGQVPPQSMPS